MHPATIKPGIWLDGNLIEPSGHIWILSYALAGCKWAIEHIKADLLFRDRILFQMYGEEFSDGGGI